MVTEQPGRPSTAFGAIAHPIRRAILDQLRDEELAAGELAARFQVSRPAVARHVRVLRQAGLIRERRRAQSRLYRLEPRALAEVDRWLAPYRLFWAARLGDLKRAVESADTSPPSAAMTASEGEESP